MSFYDEMQSVGSSILKQFNQGGLKLIQFEYNQTDNPDAPEETAEKVYDLEGVAKGITFQYQQMGYSVSTDLEVIASVVEGVMPSENDFVEVNGIRYKLIKDLSVPGAGTKVVWKFIVRKGG